LVSRQFPSPFAPLSNATQIFTFNVWDQATLIPIGFTFTYYGQQYDFIEVAENGMIMFKNSCNQGCDFDEFCDFFTNTCLRQWVGPPNGTSIPSNNSPNKFVAAWWDDLGLESTNPASVIQYRLIGNAPNRTLIVEWRNIRHMNPFTGVGSTSRTSFQIQLLEASNNIRLAYGPYTPNAADNSVWQGKVGIEDQQAVSSIVPLNCSVGNSSCASNDLQQLNNQVIEIGRPNTPELTGVVQPTFGARPGETVTVYVDVQNLGLQPTASGFDITVYLSPDNVITPGTDYLLGTGTLGALRVDGARTATITATLPLSFAPGYYNLGAYIDSGSAVQEATEANNIVVSTELFLAGADLYAYFETSPLPLPSGGTDTISFIVQNRSSAVNNMPWRVYLSLDTVLDASDTLVASGTRNFPASSTTQIDAPATVPAIPAAYYTVFAVVDPNNVLGEADEFNNEALDFVIVGTDVFPSYVITPQTSGRGSMLTLTMAIANSGSTVTDLPYEIYFSTDFNLDGADILIASGVATADRGVNTEVEVTALIPTTITPGTYNIIVSLDPADIIDELDEFNNISAMDPITLIGPDLSTESLTGGALAFLGLPYRMSATVANIGGEPVNGFFVSFHLSANNLCTASDTLLIEMGPIDLESGSRATLTPEPEIPLNTTPGVYYLCAISDSQSVVQEDREQNNIRRAAQITVRGIAPDFTVTDLLIPTIVGAGESFAVQRTLENQGNDIGSIPYDIYLVSQSGATRIALIGRATATLAAGEISNTVDTANIPADVVAGVYRIEYVIDPEELIGEIFEDNNLARSDDTIEVDSAQLLIATQTLPVATIGVEYQADLSASGGAGPLTWTITSGELPVGLALDGATGRISGTPATEQELSFTARVTDGANIHTKILKLTVAAPTVDLKIVTRSLPPIWVGQHYEYPITSLGGVPPYSWTVRPALPGGMTLTSSGTLAGETSTTAPSAVFTFTVEDAVGDKAEAPLTLRALARDDSLRFFTLSLADGQVGTDYSEALTAENGAPPYSFSLADGELPAGLSIVDGVNGTELSGVPATAGLYTFRLRVSDSRGDYDLNYFVVEVEASETVNFVTKGLPPGVTTTEYKDRDGRAVSLKAVVFSGAGTIKYSVLSGTLPDGLTLGEDGVFSGTPTKPGVFAFVARAQDTEGQTEDVRAFGIVVDDINVVGGGGDKKDDGCGCTATDTSNSEGALAFLALAAMLVVLRRRSLQRAGLIAALCVSGSIGVAREAHAGPGPAVQYFISEYSEPWVERVGGDVLSFSSVDDGEAIYTLPFSFKLYSSLYDTMHVGTNGYMSFVSYAGSIAVESYPGQFEPFAVIAPWVDDLYLGTVTVNIEGTEPNRIAVVQWKDLEHYPCCTGERTSFQLWLYEGNAARFEIHYGPQSNLNQAQYFAGAGFEDETGTLGQNLLPCAPQCSGADFEALSAGETVIRALQDAGEDIFALGVSADVIGDPLRLYQGLPFDVHTAIGAYHENPVGPFVYSLYLMAPTDVVPMGEPLFTSPEVTLGAYETRNNIDSISIPLTLEPGRYRLAMVVDTGSQVAEPNETNNISIGSQEFIVGERAADLTVGTVLPSSPSISPGQTAQVSLTLVNKGNLEASAGWRVILSQNRAPSVNDVIIAESTVDQAFQVGEQVDLTIDVAIPASLRAGQYYFGAIVDPANTVQELVEVNNFERSEQAFDVASPTVEITTTSLPVAYQGLRYESRLSAAGGNGIYTWELIGGDVPSGMTFAAGVLGGTPTDTVSASLTFRVSSNDVTAEKTLMLDVRALSGPLTIVTREMLPGIVGQPYPPSEDGQDPSTQQRIIAVGGGGTAAAFTLIAGAPAGITLDSDGFLHGVPETRGTFMLQVSATDGTTTTERTIPITIVEPGRLTLLVGALPGAALGEPYSYSIFAVGATPGSDLFFDFIPGSGVTPPGLSISRSEGVLSGTPVQAGTFTFSVEVIEGLGESAARDTASVTLVVSAPAGAIDITPDTLPDAVIGTEYVATFEARQGVGPYTWTVDNAAELPEGLMLEVIAVDGVNKLRLLGTPTKLPDEVQVGTNTGGVVSFLIKLDDSQGRHAERSVAFRVLAAATNTDEGTDGDGGCGCAAVPSSERGSAWLAGAMFGIAMILKRRSRTRVQGERTS
jgi:MYXO-CTERM domain-containing protein